MKRRYFIGYCCLILLCLIGCSSSNQNNDGDTQTESPESLDNIEENDNSSEIPNFDDESYPYSEIDEYELATIMSGFDEDWKNQVNTIQVKYVSDRLYNSYNYSSDEYSNSSNLLNYLYQFDRSDKNDYYYSIGYDNVRHDEINTSDYKAYEICCKYDDSYYNYYYYDNVLQNKQRYDYLPYYIESYFESYLTIFNGNLIDHVGIEFEDGYSDEREERIPSTIIETTYFWNGYYLKVKVDITYQYEIYSKDQYTEWNEDKEEDDVYTYRYLSRDRVETAELEVAYNSFGYAVFVSRINKSTEIYNSYNISEESTTPYLETETSSYTTRDITHNASFTRLQGE